MIRSSSMFVHSVTSTIGRVHGATASASPFIALYHSVSDTPTSDSAAGLEADNWTSRLPW